MSRCSRSLTKWYKASADKELDRTFTEKNCFRDIYKLNQRFSAARSVWEGQMQVISSIARILYHISFPRARFDMRQMEMFHRNRSNLDNEKTNKRLLIAVKWVATATMQHDRSIRTAINFTSVWIYTEFEYARSVASLWTRTFTRLFIDVMQATKKGVIEIENLPISKRLVFSLCKLF